VATERALIRGLLTSKDLKVGSLVGGKHRFSGRVKMNGKSHNVYSTAIGIPYSTTLTSPSSLQVVTTTGGALAGVFAYNQIDAVADWSSALATIFDLFRLTEATMIFEPSNLYVNFVQATLSVTPIANGVMMGCRHDVEYDVGSGALTMGALQLSLLKTKKNPYGLKICNTNQRFSSKVEFSPSFPLISNQSGGALAQVGPGNWIDTNMVGPSQGGGFYWAGVTDAAVGSGYSYGWFHVQIGVDFAIRV